MRAEPPGPAAYSEPVTPPQPMRDGGGGPRRSAYAQRDLTQGSIPRNLAFLGWPLVAEGALNSLDQLLDLFWAGHAAGARGIASIGIAQNYIMLIRLGRQGIDIGMRAMVARAVGAGDVRLANHVVLQAFTLNFMLALVTIGPGIFFTEFLLRLLGASEDLVAIGTGYMQVQFLASFAQGFRLMTGAALQAAGDSLTPMKGTMVARLVDWILTPIVMFGWLGFPALGLVGVAAVNVLSNFIGFMINSYGLLAGSSRLKLTFRGYYVDLPLIGRLVKLGLPASVTQAERSLAQLFIIGIVATFGDYALAAWALTRRVETLATLGSQGIGNASGVIAGQNIGAGRPDRATQTLAWAVGYVLILKLILGTLLFAFPVFFLSIFSQDPELLLVGLVWLRILVVGLFVQGPTQVFQQTFQISGDTIMPMLTVIATVWLVEIPMAAVLSGVAQNWTVLGWHPPLPAVSGLGQFGAAWAITLGQGSRLLIYIPYFLWGPWKSKQIFGDSVQRRGREPG